MEISELSINKLEKKLKNWEYSIEKFRWKAIWFTIKIEREVLWFPQIISWSFFLNEYQVDYIDYYWLNIHNIKYRKISRHKDEKDVVDWCVSFIKSTIEWH